MHWSDRQAVRRHRCVARTTFACPRANVPEGHTSARTFVLRCPASTRSLAFSCVPARFAESGAPSATSGANHRLCVPNRHTGDAPGGEARPGTGPGSRPGQAGNGTRNAPGNEAGNAPGTRPGETRREGPVSTPPRFRRDQ